MKKLALTIAVAAILAMAGCATSSSQNSAESSSNQVASSDQGSAESSSGEGESSSAAALYEISLAVPEGQEGEWRTDDPATQENNIVKLVSAEEADGRFTARYEAVNDGTTSINLKHYSGLACDLFYTYFLTVDNGQISEAAQPVETKAPEADALGSFLEGEWAEDDTQFATMTVAAGAAGGFDAQVVTPATHSGHIYKMTLYYDCDLQKLVYDDGSVYDVPITDSEEDELGDPKATDQQGTVEVIPTDDGKVALYWNSEANSEGRDITFMRADGNDADYADFWACALGTVDGGVGGEAAATADDGQNPVMNFVGPYACDRASMMVEASGESDATITVTWGSSATESSEWVMSGAFDPDTLTVSYFNAVKTDYVYNDDGSVKSEEIEYSDGVGRIVFHGGPLSCVWENENEPDNGAMEFTWSF